MPLEYRKGDLFASTDLDGIAHGCNTLGAMGAGIAVLFKKRWPDMYNSYKQLCSAKQLFPGDVFPYRDSNDFTVYNLMTQDYMELPDPTGKKPMVCFIQPATLPAIGTSFLKMLIIADGTRIGIPKIGTGLGGLEWDDVEKVLLDCLQKSGDKTTIVVHEL